MNPTATAWNQYLNAVLPYFGYFTVALFSVGTLAVYNWGRTKGLQKQVDQQANGRGGTTVVSVPAAAGSGVRPLIPAPVWNQLDDPLPDGTQDPYAPYDCGEECVAMIIAGCGEATLPAYILRMLLGPTGGQQGTSGRQLVYLLGLLKVPAHVRHADADTAWTEWGHSMSVGYPVIALGYWVQQGYPHWVLIRQVTPGAVTFNDPYGGVVRTMDKATAQKVYLGTYVHVDVAPTGLAPAPPVG